VQVLLSNQGCGNNRLHPANKKSVKQIVMKEIATALVKAQSEMSNPKKGASNPFFKSKYADLNSVRESVIPVLNANGISVLQPLVHVDGKNFVKTVLLHESGEMIESFTEIIFAKSNDAQAQGSGITYARRYGLQSLVCVGADDDDGNAASQPQQTKITPQQVEINKAVGEMNNVKSRAELQACWAKYPALQKNEMFIGAASAMGKIYPQ